MSLELPDIFVSSVNPEYECVRISVAYPGGLSTPPPDLPARESSHETPVCPEGYVPRPRRRGHYQLRGKTLLSSSPPERAPGSPEAQP